MPRSCSHNQLRRGSAEIRAGLGNRLRRARKIASTEGRKSPLKSGRSYNSRVGWGLCSPRRWRSPCPPPGAPWICRGFEARAKVPEPPTARHRSGENSLDGGDETSFGPAGRFPAACLGTGAHTGQLSARHPSVWLRSPEKRGCFLNPPGKTLISGYYFIILPHIIF